MQTVASPPINSLIRTVPRAGLAIRALCLLALLLVSQAVLAQTTIATWDPVGQVDETNFPVTSTAMGYTASSMSLVGATPGPSFFLDAYQTQGWSNGPEPDLTKYIQFSVTGSWNPHSILVDWFISTWGPNTVAVRSDADGYAANIATANKANTATLDLSSLGARFGTTTFRLYYYGGNPGANASTNVVDIDGTPVGGVGLTVRSTDILPPPTADLHITKANGNAGIAVPGGSLGYTITATNAGPADVPDASLVDNLPGGLSCSFTSVAAGGATGNTAAGSGNLAESLNLPSGSSVTYTLSCTVAANATGSLSNTASISSPTVTDPTPGNDSATDVVTVTTAEADLSITKTDSPDPVTAGTSLGYTITVNNAGPSDAQFVTVSDTLPAGLTLVSTSGCNEDPNGLPTCGLGSIAAGGSAMFTVSADVAASVAAGAVLSNTATVSSATGDPNGANNSATTTTTVQRSADLAITKTCTAEVVAASGADNYSCTLTVTNNGPSDASGFHVDDPIAVVTGVSAATEGLPSHGMAGFSGGTLVWDADSLPLNDKATLTFTRTVSLDAAEGQAAISNTATVSGSDPDPNAGNNSSTATTDIRWPEATFRVSKAYEGDAGPAVTVTLDCSDGAGLLEYAPQSGTTQTSLTVRRFDTTASCTVSEDEPPGYYEVDRTADCDANPVQDGAANAEAGPGVYDCTITNGVTEVRFPVTKVYSDDATYDVDVHLSCDTGLPLDQTKTISGGDPNGVTFVVTQFVNGEMNCTVSESGGPPGYTPSPSCVFEDVTAPGPYPCVFTNEARDATFTAYVEWIVPNPGSGFDDQVELTIYCNNAIDGGNEDTLNMRWWLSDDVGDGGSLTAVVDTTDRSAVCWAEQEVMASGVETSDDCGQRTIPAGGSSSCTFSNTLFYEAIPTLSQTGVALLALLMLGVGFVGFRRFA